MLVLSRSQIEQLLPMADCIEAMAAALVELAAGDSLQPLRQVHWLPDRRGGLGLMPGFLAASAALGVKAITVFAQPPGSTLPSHQGGVLLFDAATGAPEALLEAGALTEIRTAAVSAVATDRLARPDARTLTLFGAGTQARTHLEALLRVRPIERVRIWNRCRSRAERFAREEGRRHGVPIEVADDPSTAIAGSDIACTLTAAREPFFGPELLAPGLHVNAVGASVPAFRELSPEVVPRVTLFTDRRESLANEAWEYIEARRTGQIPADHVAVELGEVLTGAHPGRRTRHEVTLFRSLGLAIEDLAAARRAVRRARERGVGTEVELAG